MLLEDERNLNEFKKVIINKMKIEFDKIFEQF